MSRALLLPLALVSAGLLSACQPTTTTTYQSSAYPYNTYQSTPYRSQANCTVGTIGGAAIGGILGNQIGGGSGRDLATVGGAVAGGLIGSNASC